MKWRVLIVGIVVLACRSPWAARSPGDSRRLLRTTPACSTAPPTRSASRRTGTERCWSLPTAPSLALRCRWSPRRTSEPQLLAAGYALAGSGFRNSYKDGVLTDARADRLLPGDHREPAADHHLGRLARRRISLKLIEGTRASTMAPSRTAHRARAPSKKWTRRWRSAWRIDAAFGWPEDLLGTRRRRARRHRRVRRAALVLIAAHPREQAQVGVRPPRPASPIRGLLDHGPGNNGTRSSCCNCGRRPCCGRPRRPGNGGPVAENLVRSYSVEGDAALARSASPANRSTGCSTT